MWCLRCPLVSGRLRAEQARRCSADSHDLESEEEIDCPEHRADSCSENAEQNRDCLDECGNQPHACASDATRGDEDADDDHEHDSREDDLRSEEDLGLRCAAEPAEVRSQERKSSEDVCNHCRSLSLVFCFLQEE